MTPFTVALLQILPCKTMQENLDKGLDACRKAKQMGADLALFPELWQIGYTYQYMFSRYAMDHNHPFIQAFCAEAKKLNMAIALTYLGAGSNKPSNSVILIDQNGEIVLHYSKVHTCSFKEGSESGLEAGTHFPVVELAYAHGSVKIGAMICFDREYPESARALMLKGAEIILVPNACHLQSDPELGDVRMAQIRARAFENMVGIAVANYPAPKDDGHSCAFDPSGKAIMIADAREGIYLGTFDLKHIRKWQQNEVWGATLRKPEYYK